MSYFELYEKFKKTSAGSIWRHKRTRSYAVIYMGLKWVGGGYFVKVVSLPSDYGSNTYYLSKRSFFRDHEPI